MKRIAIRFPPLRTLVFVVVSLVAGKVAAVRAGEFFPVEGFTLREGLPAQPLQLGPEFAIALPPGVAVDEAGHGYIANIRTFYNACPSQDLATGTIRSDFTIRRNGVPVGDIPCTAPVSSMPLGSLTNELAALQVLRTIWWMDAGRAGHLPWTPGTLYDWMKARVGGFDYRDDTAYSWCCANYGGEINVVIAADTPQELDFRRTWRGIRFMTELYAHEVRHLDGYPHINCPGSVADDMDFNVDSLTTRGVQWWLARMFLEGDINVGAACNRADRRDIQTWGTSDVNVYQERFCNVQPPTVTMPQFPGGLCTPAVTEASVRARVLTLRGWNFRRTSVILVDGKRLLTTKVGKTLTAPVSSAVMPRGTPVTIKVRTGQARSPGFVFTR